MTNVQRSTSRGPLDAADVTLGGPLPSVVDLDNLVSRNGSLLTHDEIQRLILESPFLLRPASSNFDTATQVESQS